MSRRVASELINEVILGQVLTAGSGQNPARQAAIKAGRFKDEITPVEIASRKGTVVFDADEFIKSGVTTESLAGLRPAFDKAGGVTAGNASGLNDGAAVVLMMSADKGVRLPDPGDPDTRNDPPRRQEGLGGIVHRRRHGRRAGD